VQDDDTVNHASITFLVQLGDGAFVEIIAYVTVFEDHEEEDLTAEQ
jgi:hypothetical protein